MANTERAGNGEAGSRSGIESAERSAAATSEDIQAESVRGTEPGLAAGLGMKPKRVVFPIAGKGGVGKTTVSVWATHPFLPLRLVIHLSYERSWSVAEAA